MNTGLITMQGQKKIAMIAHDNKKPYCLNGPATIGLYYFIAVNGRRIRADRQRQARWRLTG